MTLQEASKMFGIPLGQLRQYEKNGLLHNGGLNGKTEEYGEDDFRQLGLVQFLLSAGFTLEKVKAYLVLMKDDKTTGEQIRMLRKQRFELLEGIHEKQQILDRIDYMIQEKKKGEVQ